MYGANAIPAAWDGRFNGKVVEPGVYVYVVELQEANGKTKTTSGDITLIR